jgi:hypothetical protein
LCGNGHKVPIEPDPPFQAKCFLNSRLGVVPGSSGSFVGFLDQSFEEGSDTGAAIEMLAGQWIKKRLSPLTGSGMALALSIHRHRN